MPREAPIITFVNASGGPVREEHPDGKLKKYFSRDARIELRPEHEKLTDRQRERQAELVEELSKDPRFERLGDRQPSLGESESESVGEE